MRRRLVLKIVLAAMTLSAGVLPTLGATPKPAVSPLQIVRKIYAVSAGKDGKYEGTSGFDDKTIRRLYFSKSLTAALRRADLLSKKRDEPIIDFDPVLNTQELPDVKSLDIQAETEAATQSVIAATFVDNDEKNVVRYDFVREGRGWKLDNMRGERGDDKWSLREMIK